MLPRPTTRTRFLPDIRRLIPEAVDRADQHDAAGEEHTEQHQRELVASVEDIANREQRRPDRQAAGDPPDRRLPHAIAETGALDLADARVFADDAPARA